MHTVILIVHEETLLSFIRPGFDLLTGELIELDLEPSRQLDLFDADGCIEGDQNAAQSGRSC